MTYSTPKSCATEVIKKATPQHSRYISHVQNYFQIRERERVFKEVMRKSRLLNVWLFAVINSRHPVENYRKGSNKPRMTRTVTNEEK